MNRDLCQELMNSAPHPKMSDAATFILVADEGVDTETRLT